MKNIIILFLLIFATTQTIKAQYVVGQTPPFQGNTTNATITGNGVTTPLGVDTTTTIPSTAKLDNSLHFLSDGSNNLQLKTGINLNAGVTTDSLFTWNPSTKKFGYRNASGISGSSEWTLATDSLYTTNANYVRVQKAVAIAVDKEAFATKNTISASVGSKSYSGFTSNNTTAGAISMADVVSFNSNDVIGITNDRAIGLYVKGTNSVAVTNRYGIFVDSILGSGSITNSYGLYYRANSRATNKFPIYIADVPNGDFASTTSYFGSNIIIGGTNVNMYLGKSSFGAYPELNYNAAFTGTNNTYTYKINDPVEQIKFSSTGMTFNTATAAAGGSAVTFRQNAIMHANGFVGIGRNATPTLNLDIDAITGGTGNPLKLRGVNAGSTLDSILTLSAGDTVKRLSIDSVFSNGIRNGINLATTIGSLRIPRLTTTQRNALNGAAGSVTGDMIYNSTTNTYQVADGASSNWIDLATGTTTYFSGSYDNTIGGGLRDSVVITVSGLTTSTGAASVYYVATVHESGIVISPCKIETGQIKIYLNNFAVTSKAFAGTLKVMVRRL